MPQIPGSNSDITRGMSNQTSDEPQENQDDWAEAGVDRYTKEQIQRKFKQALKYSGIAAGLIVASIALGLFVYFSPLLLTMLLGLTFTSTVIFGIPLGAFLIASFIGLAVIGALMGMAAITNIVLTPVVMWGILGIGLGITIGIPLAMLTGILAPVAAIVGVGAGIFGVAMLITNIYRAFKWGFKKPSRENHDEDQHSDVEVSREASSKPDKPASRTSSKLSEAKHATETSEHEPTRDVTHTNQQAVHRTIRNTDQTSTVSNNHVPIETQNKPKPTNN